MKLDTTEIRRKLIPVGSFPSYFPEMQLTESRLRWLIFNKDQNGFAACLRRVGKRIFIDADRFLVWIDKDAQSN